MSRSHQARAAATARRPVGSAGESRLTAFRSRHSKRSSGATRCSWPHRRRRARRWWPSTRIAATLQAGKRAAYTTPTKALSNQKLRELRSWLGSERVGLLTGDNVVRPEADVVVMTTEVLRNMIYAGSPHVAQFGVAVLDEVHYLQDPYRGAVWEEVIISTPAHMRLVCLSATVSNRVTNSHRGSKPPPAGARRWCSRSGPCPSKTVTCCSSGTVGVWWICPPCGMVSPIPRSNGCWNVPVPVREATVANVAQVCDRRDHGAPRSWNTLPPPQSCPQSSLCSPARVATMPPGRSRRRARPSWMPPSSTGYARSLPAHTASLESGDLNALGYHEWLEGLTAGVAAHHAGLVPAFKEAIEDCFAAGLLAVVFATETLAVGVNMPARSVVIEQLSRFRGEGFAALTPGEYTQLTGRAGRRGIDEIGYAYTLWHPHTAFGETARLAASNDFELESSFRPTYNMVANLIASRTRDEAVEMLQRSFAQWRADRRVGEWTAALEVERRELREARARLRSMGGGSARPQAHAPQRGGSGVGHRHRRGKPTDRRLDRALVDAERQAERTGARVSRLKDRIKLAKGGLAQQLDAINEILNIFGCADGWSLNPAGECLKSVFHESDLLTVLCLREGVFDGVAPARLAGLVSVLTYEHRSSRPPPAPRYRDNDCRDRAALILELATQINRAERQHNVVASRPPDASFFATAHAWADGATYIEAVAGRSLRWRRTCGR